MRDAVELAGPLRTTLCLAQWKRASSPGTAGTSGFLSVSDSARRVPAELGQESQESSCLRKGTRCLSRCSGGLRPLVQLCVEPAGVSGRCTTQRIFPTQGSNPGLPHCRRILYHVSHKRSPRILEWVIYPFSSESSQPRNRTGVSRIAGGFFTN